MRVPTCVRFVTVILGESRKYWKLIHLMQEREREREREDGRDAVSGE